MSTWADEAIAAVLRKREENGWRHLHHRDCIHNLPPAEQVALRGRTIEWWLGVMGSLPVQITAADWETDPPDLPLPPVSVVAGNPDKKGDQR